LARQRKRMTPRLPEPTRIQRFRHKLLRWFEENARTFPWRRPNQPTYRLVITEILLQRTRAETVATFYAEFFRTFASWRQLAAARNRELERFLRPLGLWRRRAAVLVGLATAVHKRRGRLPVSREEIEQLPGVGQYIANAIQLVQWHVRSPLLDVNMARVLERYFGPRRLADIRYDPYLQKLARTVVDSNDALRLNWAILDLAAMICRKRSPRCPVCPLRLSCNYARGVSRARDD